MGKFPGVTFLVPLPRDFGPVIGGPVVIGQFALLQQGINSYRERGAFFERPWDEHEGLPIY